MRALSSSVVFNFLALANVKLDLICGNTVCKWRGCGDNCSRCQPWRWPLGSFELCLGAPLHNRPGASSARWPRLWAAWPATDGPGCPDAHFKIQDYDSLWEAPRFECLWNPFLRIPSGGVLEMKGFPRQIDTQGLASHSGWEQHSCQWLPDKVSPKKFTNDSGDASCQGIHGYISFFK